MTGFFAVVLPLLVVVGAFMWMQPSKRDQRLAKLRSEALLKGFRIDSLRVPDTSEFGRVNDKYQIVTLYQRSVSVERDDAPNCTVMRTSGEAGIHLPVGWVWEARNGLNDRLYEALSAELLQLPQSITVIRVAQDSVGLCWDEQDPLLDFDKLKQAIESIAGVFDKKVV